MVSTFVRRTLIPPTTIMSPCGCVRFVLTVTSAGVAVDFFRRPSRRAPYALVSKTLYDDVPFHVVCDDVHEIMCTGGTPINQVAALAHLGVGLS